MKQFGIVALMVLSSLKAFAHEHGSIKVYNAQLGLSTMMPGSLLIADGVMKGRNIPEKALALSYNLEHIREYFYEIHNRKSWDDQGSDIKATINSGKNAFIDLYGMRENAAWLPGQKRFVFGVGKENGLDNFEEALEVVAHEYTHAIIQTTSNLKYQGQSGALNEHLADVFGVLINKKYNNPANPFFIGKDVFTGTYAMIGRPMRNMENPQLGISSQPGSMQDLNLRPRWMAMNQNCVPTDKNDLCGVHVLSGIPNKMASIIIKGMGNDVEASELFYNVMTKRLKENSNFSDYKLALLEECKSLSPNVCEIVEQASKAVGI